MTVELNEDLESKLISNFEFHSCQSARLVESFAKLTGNIPFQADLNPSAKYSTSNIILPVNKVRIPCRFTILGTSIG